MSYSVTWLLHQLGGQLFEDWDCHVDLIVYICHALGCTHWLSQQSGGTDEADSSAYFDLHV